MLSGILFVIRNGLRWRDAPVAYGPSKTLYNRFVRWSRMGVFNRIFVALAGAGDGTLMIDATSLKAHRTAASLLKKGLYPDVSGVATQGLTSKLHIVCDGRGRPLRLHLTKGQRSDHKAAATLMPCPPAARLLPADKAYASYWMHRSLQQRGITACIPAPRIAITCPATTPASTDSAIALKTCLQSSTTGDASIPDAPTSSSQP